MKAQKPGRDMYLYSTFSLFFLCLFILTNYSNIDSSMLDSQNAETLDGTMVFMVFLHILIIILERFVSRSDTKVHKTK